MKYEYKGMLPIEEQRKAITKLIEELAAQIGSSVERLELIETDDYVVIGTDENDDDILLEGSNVPHFEQANVTFANYDAIDWRGTNAGQLYANLEDRLNEEYGLFLYDTADDD